MKLIAEKTLAYLVKPGETLSFLEGDFVVKSAGFGDPHVDGFVNLDGRTAAPWVFELDGAGRFVVHPRHRVTRKR